MFPVGFPTITFDEKFFRDLAGAADAAQILALKLSNFREPLKMSLAAVVIPSVATNFKSGGRPPWKALAETTVLDRGSAGPILVRTGKLFSAAISVGNWELTNDSLSIDSLDDKVSYAGYNQQGTRRMPARPFIGLQNSDVDDIIEIFELWIEKNVAEVWGVSG